MLQERSILIDLTIRKWTAVRHDRKVSAEVEQTHAAKDAGRYNKQLIDKAHLADIETAASALRKFHYSRTLPWNDSGQRLLPSALLFEYRDDLNRHKAAFSAAVGDFLNKYPSLIQAARMRLGSMYEPQDYPDPNELRKLFDVETRVLPVPAASDFRVDLSKEMQDELRAEVEQTIQERQVAVVKDCWSRMREIVSRIAEQCSKEKPVIYDSLMKNASDLAGILSGLNITGDPALAAAEVELRNLIVPTTTLRDNPIARKRAADGAAAILEKMPW